MKRGGYKMRRVVKVTSQYRTYYPWAYELACGHVWRGNKSTWGRNGVEHPGRIKCEECSQSAEGGAV